ncbi:phosphoglycolate phosphatase-like HAD superfamily hydrolase [Saccharopolyspora lacisalsi]|uniref:Phosphoglycolate phosphatase-like HAD superfamily hydrolase n=1 Tax=Halosaccharopolyspora lacisalsi TaxID=1000566 RepID=A0A839E3B2_9PSEU|nr:HAD family phosphatase [Halosaccharopolyspora lacisalsi]MBA8826227.1 phosphoglycolate phosphatase-like HAD superfamily hydrolase [Halosaccharopolyspora lacisalsi]
MSSRQFNQLELVCVNIDGVLLPDTFSPVMHRFLTKHGAAYTGELERLIFSQPRIVGGANMASAARLPWSPDRTIAAYFEERDAYLAEHPLALADGAGELLERLVETGAEVICYGGLGREPFDEFLAPHKHLFSEPGYITTNDIRPGIKEITTEHFGRRYDQVLFIDDVNRFAEFAKDLDVAFVGVPSDFEHSFQRTQMTETGVKHIVRSLHEIDHELLTLVDKEAASGTSWSVES